MRWVVLALLLALPSCDEPAAPESPGPSIQPQRISFADIEANELHGSSCAFASGASMAPIVMAFHDRAVMKIDGEILRFRIDRESVGAQVGDDARYLAEDRVLLLTIEEAGGLSREGPATFDGAVRLTDGAGAVLFAARGAVQCAP